MQKLAVVASGEGEKRELELHLVAYVPASIELRDWAWSHLHKKFWLEAAYSQTELDFEPSEEDEDEDEEELDPDNEGPAAKKATKAKPKSGPKQLAEFHAAQPN